jgi:hypothetical protein
LAFAVIQPDLNLYHQHIPAPARAMMCSI